MARKVISQVTFEIGEIDRLLGAYQELVQREEQSTPHLVELTALASVLHSFYNGLENIFLSIAKGIDKNVPTGAQWHRELLTQMTLATAKRTSVITRETARQLGNYLSFRHFYRHSYSFFLEWNELEKLVTPLPEVWRRVKQELQAFLNGLRAE